MSGGIGALFGGGNLFGAVLNIASMVFPALQIASSLANMISQAVGGALKGAVDQLAKEAGMPKFLADMVKKMVDEVMSGQQNQAQGSGDAQADQATQSEFGGDVQKMMEDLMKAIVEGAKNIMQQDKGDGKSSKSSGKGSGKGASSWLEAIAKAMGEAAGNKAAKMVELSNKLKELSSAGGSEKDQQAAAKEMNAVNAQFQAVSQEFNMLQSAFSTAIKALGEGLAQMARKQ